MDYRFFLPVVSIALTTFAKAGDVTVEPRSFVIEKSFNAVVLPDQEPTPVSVKAEKWADFKIKKVVAHGDKVKKGDVIIAFDTEGYEQKLVDAKRAIKTSEMTLAQAEQDLAWLEKTTNFKLDALRRAAAINKEEQEYFVKTRRSNTEKMADQALKRKIEALENEREELRQLEKMYKADDLTEETEEIILTRQKAMVEASIVNLELEKENNKRIKEVALPREAITIADAERDSAIALARGEKDLPRALEMKKLEVEGMKIARERELKNLADLEKDHGCFEIKAPVDGVFYYGAIENGRWSPNPELVKAMVIDGRVPAQKVLASIIPAGTKYSMVAFLDEASARVLKEDASATAVVTGRDDLEIDAKLQTLAAVPAADGSYRAKVSASWPSDLTVTTGTTAKVTVQAYAKDKAMVVPTKALTRSGKDWQVDVKLADGKSEKRKVKRGRTNGDQVEILSGLEHGQVVIVP